MHSKMLSYTAQEWSGMRWW